MLNVTICYSLGFIHKFSGGPDFHNLEFTFFFKCLHSNITVWGILEKKIFNIQVPFKHLPSNDQMSLINFNPSWGLVISPGVTIFTIYNFQYIYKIWCKFSPFWYSGSLEDVLRHAANFHGFAYKIPLPIRMFCSKLVKGPVDLEKSKL